MNQVATILRAAAERAEIRAFASRVIAAAQADEVMPIVPPNPMGMVAYHRGKYFSRRDVELLVFKLARELDTLAKELEEVAVHAQAHGCYSDCPDCGLVDHRKADEVEKQT